MCAAFKGKIYFMVQCSLFSAMLCICSPLALPIGVIPMTFSLFAVVLTGIVLEAKKAFLSVVLYLLMGICGLPVFSGAQAGIGVLFGPTGGYLWSYAFTAMLAGISVKTKIQNETIKKACVFAISMSGVLVCYVCGTAQYMFITGCELGTALAVCVYGFVIFDVVKTLLAVIVGMKLKGILIKASVSL